MLTVHAMAMMYVYGMYIIQLLKHLFMIYQVALKELSSRLGYVVPKISVASRRKSERI